MDHNPDLVGEFILESCPKCGCSLIGNKVGDKWCSFVQCNYGIEELHEKYVRGKEYGKEER